MRITYNFERSRVVLTTDDTIVLIQTEQLIADPIIDKLYPPKEDLQLRASIAVSGIKEPLVIRTPGMMIISGHRRWRIASKLGIDKVPCVLKEDGITSEAGRLFAILAHNIGRELHVVDKVQLGCFLRPYVERLMKEVVDETVGSPDSTEMTDETILLLEIIHEALSKNNSAGWEECVASLVGLDTHQFVSLAGVLEAARAGDTEAQSILDTMYQHMVPLESDNTHGDQEVLYIADVKADTAIEEYPMVRSSAGEFVRFDYAEKADRHAYMVALVCKDMELRNVDVSRITSIYIDPGRPMETAVVWSSQGPCLLSQADSATKMQLAHNLVATGAITEIMEIGASDLVHCGVTGARIVCYADAEVFNRFRRGISGWLEVPVLLRKTILF